MKIRTKCKYFLFGSLLLSNYSQVTAQQELNYKHLTSQALSSQILDEIVVKNDLNKEKPSLKTYVSSGSFSYLDDTDITNFRGSSVGDFLSGVPGVIVGNKRNSGAVSINIRGIANENRVPVFIDDGLQSIPSYQGYAGSSTRSYLDPDLLGEVEIEKGPSLSVDGSGATGGIVRMKTISWKDIIPEGKTWGVRLKLGSMTNTVTPPAYYTKGGYQTRYISKCITNESGLCKTQNYAPDARYSSSSFDLNSYNYSIAFANKLENADFVLAYAKRKQGNYFVGRHGQTPIIDKINFEDDYVEVDENQDDEEIQIGVLKFKENHSTLYRAGEEALNTSQDNSSYLIKANFYNDYHRLGLAYRYYHSKFGEIMPSILNFRAYGALQGEGSEVKVNSYNLSYQYKPVTPYINLNLNAYFTDSDSSNFTPFIEEYGYSLSSRHARFLISKQKGLSIDNTSIFQINKNPLTLKYGIAHSYERIYQPRDAQQRVLAKGYPEDAIAPLWVRDGKRKEISGFISANYPFTSWLKAEVGLRYFKSTINDYVIRKEVVTESKKVIENGVTKFVDITKEIIHKQKPIENKGTSPIVMLTFEPKSGIQIYTKYAQALRSPSLFQGTKGWSMQNTENNLEQLKPEHAKNFEIGMNLFYENIFASDDLFGFKLAYFNNRIKDYLTRTQKGSFAQTVNIQSAKFKGFELSAYYDMKKFYTKLSGTYYTNTEFCLTQEQAGNKAQCNSGFVFRSNLNNAVPPRLNLHLTLGSRWLDQKLDIGARYSYYSKRFVPVLSADRFVNTASIEWNSYSLLDLYASYDVTKNFKINMTMDNVFNRYYLDTNNMGLNTAPGRTLHFGIDYRF
ncbi:hemoglobin/transferrin/lactoferrin receptor protein [Bisgaardia hudsonensis]|uniref:Hemoglobin/transferrin/lactoferrin receptor protein n=1 Tax=Bisgaardia hudsonensis TaxID=109472 RepID=A0A4R2N1F6_9PAST|nr:TonB-dependent receptor [Bisgaardia hudsonensis]QLB13055.1 ligand-gated channel protein [Bisgaardia hudsonensis]TCP13379.1 hemoglobin/transferrin/lactoferrin receptor protein [Bisgaardia hudsonensis]